MSRGALVAASVTLIAAASLGAQQPPPATTFRADVNRVLVTALVTEADAPVSGLRASDFEVLDNKVPQQIDVVEVRSQPVDVTVVLDPSLSVAVDALQQFVADLQKVAASLAPVDRVRLITSGTTVMDVSGLRPGGSTLPTDRVVIGGATSLYNAITAALVLGNRVERPQLIFAFTDGFDSMSFIGAERVVAVARRSAASLYLSMAESSLAVKPTHAAGAAYIGGPNRNMLRDMADATGGAVFARAPGTSLSATFASVMQRFRSGYLLTFVPTGVSTTGWHDLVVRMKDRRYSVRARRGYEAG